MVIIIPSEWTYDGQTYTLSGREKLELGPSTMGSDPLKNPLFEATLKFMVNPFSSNNYSNIEKNIKYYLDVDFMTRASQEVASFEYDENEYREQVTYVWEQLQALEMGKALEMMETYIGTDRLEKDTLRFIRDNLLDAGASTTLMDFLTRLGFKRVMGMAIKGEEGTALWDAAKRQVPYKPALEEIYKDDGVDYIDLKVQKNNMEKDGSITYFILMTIDMESVFEKLMSDAGMNMAKKKHRG